MPRGGNRNPQGNNAKLPSPPDEVIQPWLKYYCGEMNRSDKKVAELLRKHYDTTKFNMGAKTVYRKRTQFGILSTRQQKHNFDSIAAPIAEIRTRFPSRGAESITSTLRLEYNMKVSNKLVRAYLQQTEPDAVANRKQKRWKRKRFVAAGVNDVWGMDQHDKWGRFGLWLHNGIDPFSGMNLWMKVWWTNHNPRLIAKYYLDACRAIQGVPMTTQSDPGTENFGIANIQTVIRQMLDPTLVGTMQHRFMIKHNSIKNEANWSVLRRTWSEGFQNLFDQGVNDGLYDPANALEKSVFLWLAIPMVQAELDSWVLQRNRVAPWHDKNKVLPHGAPELINLHPEEYGTKDFKVHVPSDLFDQLEAKYAPSDHPVFQFCSPAFNDEITAHYKAIGEPPVSTTNFWDVYSRLLARLRVEDEDDLGLSEIIANFNDRMAIVDQDTIELLANNKPFRVGQNLRDKQLAPNSEAHEEPHQKSCYATFSDEEGSGPDEEGLAQASTSVAVGCSSFYATFSDEEDSSEEM